MAKLPYICGIVSARKVFLELKVMSCKLRLELERRIRLSLISPVRISVRVALVALTNLCCVVVPRLPSNFFACGRGQ